MSDRNKRALAGTGKCSSVVFFSVLGGLIVSLLPLEAEAQGPPRPPTREEITGPSPDQTPFEPRVSVVAGDDTLERGPCPFAAPEFAHLNFVLNGVHFVGASSIDTSFLGTIWSDLVGRNISVATICDIRDRAATQLRASGYLAAVRIPPQTIEDGALQLDILAARIARLEITGDAGASAGLLRRYLRPLQDQPVFNTRDAERYLLLARDIPGLDARLTLRPGDLPGELVGEVIVSRTPVAVDLSVQNYGARDVGRVAGSARVHIAGLTGMGDLTTASYYTSSDLESMRVIQLSHDFRLGGDGLMLGAGYTHAWTEPQRSSAPIESESRIGILHGAYPLHLTQASTISVSGGLEFIDQDITLAGIPLNQDRLRVLNLRVEGQWVDPASLAGRRGFGPTAPRWAVRASVEARQGLSGLGASDDCGANGLLCLQPGAVPLTRIEGQPDAALLRANLLAEWRLDGDVSLSASVRAQVTDQPLLSYEEFSAGSFNVGRGFDPGTIMGDSGVGGSIEVRRAKWIAMGDHFAFRPFAFLDAAQVWNEDAAFAGVGPQRLYSAGGGAQVALGRSAQLNLALAAPLNRGGFLTERPDPRLLFSLTTQFGRGR